MSASYDVEAQKSAASDDKVQRTISPITGQAIIERPLPSSNAELDLILAASHTAHLSWRKVPLAKRKAIVIKAISHLSARAPELAEEITEQMGRPIRYTKSEIATFEDRALWLVNKAEKALADESVDEGRPEGLKRVIRRAPVGVTLLVGAWNVSPACSGCCRTVG